MVPKILSAPTAQPLEGKPASTNAPPPWRRPHQIVPVLLWGFFLVWAFGRVARDRWWLSGLTFYIPTPVVTTCLLVLMAWETGRRQLRAAALTATLLATCVCSLVVSENRFVPTATSASPGKTLRAVHWNVLSGKLGWPQVQEHLRTLDADLYVLSEPPWDLEDELFPGYEGAALGAMSVFARGRIEPLGYASTQKWMFLHLVRCTIDDQVLLLLLADLPSNVLVHRQPLLEELNRQIAVHQPDLVLGDLNAPRDSLELTRLPTGYAHAYNELGSGWSYSWPMPLPVYSLDHCLFGPRVEPEAYRLGWTLLSDHRPQVFDFQVRSEKSAGAPRRAESPAPAPISAAARQPSQPASADE